MYTSSENISNSSFDQTESSGLKYDYEKNKNNEINYLNSESFNDNSINSGNGGAKRSNRYNPIHNAMYNDLLVYGPITEEEFVMKGRLSYFFMNTYEKFQAKRRIPWKFVLQITKLIILTYQLIDFGALRSLHINFIETSELSLKHLYLEGWDLSYETMPYPPSLGKMAAYTVQEFYDNVDFLLARYNATQEIAIGNFNFASDDDAINAVEMCSRYFDIGDVWSFNETFVLNTKLKKDCFRVYSVFDKHSKKQEFSIQQFLLQNNRTLHFNGLIDVTLSFSLRTIHLKSLHRSSEPDCYQFNIKVLYDNGGHNGQMEVLMTNDVENLPCHGCILSDRGIDPEWVSSWFFNAFVLIVCSLSSSLCTRSFSRALMLKNDTVKFFSKFYPQRVLDWKDLLELVDFWYILIMLNDFLSIMGCIYKILIQVKWSSSYELCGLLLGTGSLFAWFGVLRYLALFKSFNILIVTVKLAVPNILKFLVCAFFIFLGFSICGWIVLGPYHIKFRELATSLECLYSLINGDDIFATFASMNKVGLSVWLFSRLYLYIFMSLFIYVVLSMFISIIADTYDSIKHPDSDIMMKSFLMKFSQGHGYCIPNEQPWSHVFQTLLRLFGYKKSNQAASVRQGHTGGNEDEGNDDEDGGNDDDDGNDAPLLVN